MSFFIVAFVHFLVMLAVWTRRKKQLIYTLLLQAMLITFYVYTI